MRRRMLFMGTIAFTSLLALASSEGSAAERLSDILRHSKWDGIIGTWVDAETNGAVVKTIYAWKIADRVIEVTTKDTSKETIGLMGVNGMTGEVFHMGADSDGTSFLGTWISKDDGDAMLGIVYSSGDGKEGALSIRHHLEDKDTMIVTVELPQPIKFKMIRVKPQPSVIPMPRVISTGIFLRGGGSTFIKPAMDFWCKTYEKKSGVHIEYSAQGSSKGIEGVTANFLDFGCSDAFLRDDLLQRESNIVHIPLALGAVVPTYNVVNHAGEPLSLRLTGTILASMFLGKVKKWNDESISLINPSVKLPDLEITVVYRKDGSGTTAIWTDYLSKVSPIWKIQVGVGSKDLKWPVGIAVEKNDGIARTVNQTPGAIGYVEFSYAIMNGLPTGFMQNKAGEFVEPSLEGMSAAAAASLTGIADDLRFSLTNAPGSRSYPIVGTCWAILRTKGERRRSLVDFLRWVTSEGQTNLTKLYYGRLPNEFSEKISKLLDKVELAE